MRVHLIKKQSIEGFVRQNAQSKQAFRIWLAILNQVDWKMPEDIISTFSSADIIGQGSNRVVFNIGGNKYRMICKYYFGKARVHLFVKWIGSHATYTKLCKEGQQYDVDIY